MKTGEYPYLQKLPVDMIEASFYQRASNGDLICELCAHECRIKPNGFGICGVRINTGEKLTTLTYGRLVASNPDPIEKKPLYHFLPGSSTFSIAASGCNFKCGFCQNWEISQALRGNAKRLALDSSRWTPDLVVAQALENECRSIAFTYTEPTVFYEFMKDVSTIAQGSGLKTAMVTNGFMSEKTIDACCLFIDVFNVDLKSFSDIFYRQQCGGSLQPVLDTIKRIVLNDKWLELTTLLIPGLNDSSAEIKEAADFIARLNPDIPWHLSRFFPRYHFANYVPTPESSIINAKKIALESGLKFVYCGNIGDSNTTNCPQCGEVLIVRRGYRIQIENIKEGRCVLCSSLIAGVWDV